MIVGVAALLGGCAMNPVTGRPMFVLVSEAQEIELGKSYAPQIAASMGLYEDEELQRYVESIGMPMAQGSERPDLPWQFRVVDDAAINAFAVPGGFIYVTRGILAHMGSEAELASVLGHEVGHVTARHSVSQISKQQLASIGLVVGSIALGEAAGLLVPIASQGMQLLFLSHGRDDERQSDDLGLRYMTEAGYDPHQMVEMFRTLGRSSPSEGARVPEWLSTHPNPENREARIEAAILELERVPADPKVGRDVFMRAIDGVVYGPDPRAGYFADQRFHHPDLRFRLDFPEGWNTANQTQAVLGISGEQDAMLQLTLAQGETVKEASDAFFAQQGLQSGNIQTTKVNGLSAVTGDFAVATAQANLRGVAHFVALGDHIYQLLGYAAANAFEAREGALRASLGSFRRETSRAVLNAKPWRIDIVRPKRSLSIADFARTYPGPVEAEELARINELDAGERYPAGRPAKRVVGRVLPR